MAPVGSRGGRGRRLTMSAPAFILHCQSINSSIQSSVSFQLPALPLHLQPSRRLYSNKSGAADGDSNSDGSVFNENAILGETLDVNLRGGTYSWSNPNAISKDDTRLRSNQSRSTASSASNEDRYKRIPFDGCGSILLHQQPEDFVEPNASNQKTGDLKGDGRRRRQKGRTGVTLWSASYAMSYYIDAQWSKGGSWYHDDIDINSNSQNKWTVLELGAGLGLCSAVAAKRGMNVVSTDNDPAVLQLLKENLNRNAPASGEDIEPSAPDDHESKQQSLSVHSLDWLDVADDPRAESSHPVFLQLESLGGADLILLSDVIYGATEPAWDALLILLNKFCAQRRRLSSERIDSEEGTTAISKSMQSGDDGAVFPRVILGYTQRRRDMSPQDEARFFAMVQAAGMEAVLIPSTSIPNGEKYMLTSLFELRWIG